MSFKDTMRVLDRSYRTSLLLKEVFKDLHKLIDKYQNPHYQTDYYKWGQRKIGK